MENIKNKIDYTLLSENSSKEDIELLCEKAHSHNFATVCVLPNMVEIAKQKLNNLNSNVGVTTVVSFPHGTNDSEEKRLECVKAIENGADEIDMVINYNNIKNNDPNIYYEINLLSTICHKSDKILKVIVESGLLSNEETRRATIICVKSGADYIKTSTGKVEIGAEIDKVKIMYEAIRNLNSDMKIKASGGIRKIEDIELFDQYVDRFGIGSSSVDKMLNISNIKISDY